MSSLLARVTMSNRRHLPPEDTRQALLIASNYQKFNIGKRANLTRSLHAASLMAGMKINKSDQAVWNFDMLLVEYLYEKTYRRRHWAIWKYFTVIFSRVSSQKCIYMRLLPYYAWKWEHAAEKAKHDWHSPITDQRMSALFFIGNEEASLCSPIVSAFWMSSLISPQSCGTFWRPACFWFAAIFEVMTQIFWRESAALIRRLTWLIAWPCCIDSRMILIRYITT